MLIKPAVNDETILACLREQYSLSAAALEFLPIGGDASTAVYRAEAGDGTAYFCKLKLESYDEVSVELPAFFESLGIRQVIAPLRTIDGSLSASISPASGGNNEARDDGAGAPAPRLVVYPFVAGASGFDVLLTESQWSEFGTALWRIHTADVPPALGEKISVERFSPEWRDQARVILDRLEHETFTEPVEKALADYVRPRREVFLTLLERAERLAQELAARENQFVLCHSDIHPGNLFISAEGPLYIVDWDYPVLALKERDLMFVGGGQGYVDLTKQEEESQFYRYYRPAEIDPLAMEYYSCERNIVDLTVECRRIFSRTVSDSDRAQSLQIITWLFLPGGSVEIALKERSSSPQSPSPEIAKPAISEEGEA